MQMTWSKKTKGTFLLLAAAVWLAGCGKAAGGAADSAGYNSSYIAESPAYSSDQAKSEEAAEYDYAGAGNGTISPDNSNAQETGEKLVYRGSLNIQTKDYEDSASKLRALVREYNGLIESEEEYEEGSYYTGSETKKLWALYTTVRIPTDRYSDFMSGSAEIGNVVSRSSSAENISRRYNDVSAQIEALEKQQTRLLEMMDEAKTIEDMIAVEDRLSEVQYQLNSLKTNRESMDTDIAYSTISIVLREVRVYAEVNESFLQRLGNRLGNGFVKFGDDVQSLILGFAGALPYLLVLAVILIVLKKTGVFSRLNIRMPKIFRKKNQNE